MEWISVKEKLPENLELVLCHTHLGMLISQSYCMYTDQDDKWFKERFTHWMPLPEPPKQCPPFETS
jgi:hypothetical protein